MEAIKKSEMVNVSGSKILHGVKTCECLVHANQQGKKVRHKTLKSIRSTVIFNVVTEERAQASEVHRFNTPERKGAARRKSKVTGVRPFHPFVYLYFLQAGMKKKKATFSVNIFTLCCTKCAEHATGEASFGEK